MVPDRNRVNRCDAAGTPCGNVPRPVMLFVTRDFDLLRKCLGLGSDNLAPNLLKTEVLSGVASLFPRSDISVLINLEQKQDVECSGDLLFRDLFIPLVW